MRAFELHLCAIRPISGSKTRQFVPVQAKVHVGNIFSDDSSTHPHSSSRIAHHAQVQLQSRDAVRAILASLLRASLLPVVVHGVPRFVGGLAR